MSDQKHGKAVGAFRWCDGCRDFHGYLYICKHYNNEIIKQIEKDRREFKKQLKEVK